MKKIPGIGGIGFLPALLFTAQKEAALEPLGRADKAGKTLIRSGKRLIRNEENTDVSGFSRDNVLWTVSPGITLIMSGKRLIKLTPPGKKLIRTVLPRKTLIRIVPPGKTLIRNRENADVPGFSRGNSAPGKC